MSVTYRPKHDTDTPITGNIEGIRKSLLAEMESLYEFEPDRSQFAPASLLEAMARFTGMIGREIAVYLSRDGTALDVIIGEAHLVSLPNIRTRRSLSRLSGVRCIHTHPGGIAALSELDMRALESARFDAMAALGVSGDGKPTGLCAAVLSGSGETAVRVLGTASVNDIPQEEWFGEILIADKEIGGGLEESKQVPERAVLVCIDQGYGQAALSELKRLTETAGAVVLKTVTQNRLKPDSATYIGKGKAEEISLVVRAADADIVIIDDELSGTQLRNLEEIFSARVVDRTALILDIFAQRAQSREGKLQVWLAQLQYRLPRLSGTYDAMSRLGGGIGTRGPGESQLETDRRHIRRQIEEIKRQLDDVKKQRDVRRGLRAKNEIPVVALVGYTNAGKSTLLNLLSGSDVFVEDKLFATLDTVTRRVTPENGNPFLLIDTVGFIHKLPHNLIDAFRSTLEEVLYADLLVLVHDMSAPDLRHQQEVVDEVLASLGAGDKPRLNILNKIDLCESPSESYQKYFPISAISGQGKESLINLICETLRSAKIKFSVSIPYDKGALLSRLHENAAILEERFEENGTFVTAHISPEQYMKLAHQLGDSVQILEGAHMIPSDEEEYE